MTAVLFVDDEPNILNAIKRAVLDETFNAHFALCGQEALEILEKEPIGVIVTDIRMPGMDGLTLLRKVKEKYPETVRIVLSGYTQLGQVIATINQGEIFQFITKPWKMEEELLSVVRRGVEYFEVHQKESMHKESLEKRVLGYRNIFREMETKIANLKNNFYAAKIVNTIVFDFIKKDCADSKLQTQDLMKRINMLETAVQSYLAILPLQTMKMKRAKLIHSLIERVEPYFAVNDQSHLDEQSEMMCMGNNDLLYWVLELLLPQLRTGNLQTQCRVHAKLGSNNDYHLGILLRVTLPTEKTGNDVIGMMEYVVKIVENILQDQLISIEYERGHNSAIIMLSGAFKIIS